MEFEFNIRGEASGKKREQKPFNLLVLGNFGGKEAADNGVSDGTVAKKRIVCIDLDNADDLWTWFAPRVDLQIGSSSMSFTPRDIEDFHPDQLYRSLPLFGEIRTMRQQLRDPQTAQTALDQIIAAGSIIEGELINEPEQTPSGTADEGAEAMFERLLGRASEPSATAPGGIPELQKLDAFLRKLVAPHIVREPDPRVETALDSTDLVAAELMRRVLHHPEFQALETRWRSLFNLISELELNEDLQLYVCDISRQELLSALPDPGTSLQDSELFQLLVERRRQASDDTPWSVIVGDYYFGPNPEDIALLTGLGAAAAVNGGAFLGGALPEVLGCNTTAELADARYWSSGGDHKALWHSLRTSTVAPYLGLALPRILARLPYGGTAEEIDSFAFEEMPERNHEGYLWGNPAFACARLLAKQFSREGWRMEPGDHVDLGFLPAYHYTQDGESRLQPCAELLLSESTMVNMFEHGLMPLISYRNQNTVVLGRFQSIASPASALAGPWQ